MLELQSLLSETGVGAFSWAKIRLWSFKKTTWRDFLCLFFLATPHKAIMRRRTLFDDGQWCWKLVESFWQCSVVPVLREGHDVMSMAKRRMWGLHWLWVDRVGGIKSLQNFTSLMQMMKLKESMGGVHSQELRMDRKLRDTCHFPVSAQGVKILVL